MVVYFPLRGFSVAGITHNPESCSELQRDAIAHSNVLKARATLERTFANARHAVGYRYARKSGATVERIMADARDTVGNRDAGQAYATRERIITDRRGTVGNCDTRKTLATPERISADTRHAVRDRYAHKAAATEERSPADARYTISYRDVHKVAAIIERFRADVRHAIRNCDARKARAIRERKTTDRYDAVRNCDTRKTLATPERISADRRDDLSVIDRRDFDIDVGASSDSGNRTGSVSVGHELQTFRAFVQGCSGGEDSGGFHGINPFFPWRSSLGVMPYALGVTISAGTVLCVSHPGLEPAMAALRWLLTLFGRTVSTSPTERFRRLNRLRRPPPRRLLRKYAPHLRQG